MRDRIFYTICFGFLFGVLLRSFISLDLYLAILFSVISLALILFFSLISKNNWGILISVFILTFCFGIFRFHMVDVGAPNIFESQVGQKNTFIGVIVDEPDVRPNDQLLTVETTSGTAATKVLISSDVDQDFKYGDEINFTGKLTKPENFLTDQGKTFDYMNYLRKDGILYTMSYPVTDIISRGNGNKIKSFLFFAKEKFLDKINFLLPSPESIFASGLMLGDRSDFDQTLKQNFVNTGMIHLVTLSGYKVTMVAGWFIKLFSFLPLGTSIGIGILAVWCFVLMTGGIASAVRAGMMATLALIARATGRNYDVARALILTAVLMVLLNPFVLFYDVSFQLSFLGTIAIIFFTPKVEKYFTWVTSRFYLQEITTMTCAIYIFVFPFILYKMGDFSLVTLPANILIMPLFPLTIMFGFLTGFVGILSNTLAAPFAYMTYFSLHYQLFVINFFANLSFAAFNIPNFSLWLTLLIYACLTYILFWKSIKNFFSQNSLQV
jgi:competence protein ComEC